MPPPFVVSFWVSAEWSSMIRVFIKNNDRRSKNDRRTAGAVPIADSERN